MRARPRGTYPQAGKPIARLEAQGPEGTRCGTHRAPEAKHATGTDVSGIECLRHEALEAWGVRGIGRKK